mmetsp:Transcript_41454/g.117364  ORF Transcript_41454/g.117364 Transcript_41454/m.117364 type:complete len:80 (-) Transcript_41454:184-423(-)|eukprot:CAMPEP_0176219666 /NCGR_PEP_ID=MMETSP0121_2-20121125/18824_1 /TAXON_ID=160619 /ORGANISM="Kryptoperidinium foliaceum, Strain CCMP 1326" /LENGTH=79 /DNA_ID=CAMNT_0017558831 /DNA_START=208 /DNA_END=447 /DNA_ORIENTATION=+
MMEPDLGHSVVGLERLVELRTKELVQLLPEMEHYHKQGMRVPQLEYRVNELKHQIKSVMDEYEVDPRNEWTIKAHELLA